MKEIRALTGLRGIAALIVFWGHTHEWLISRGLSADVPQVIQRLLLSGGRQVDIFFVLSGFILGLIYRDWFTRGMTQAAYWEFLRRRVARIWPLVPATKLWPQNSMPGAPSGISSPMRFTAAT